MDLADLVSVKAMCDNLAEGTLGRNSFMLPSFPQVFLSSSTRAILTTKRSRWR